MALSVFRAIYRLPIGTKRRGLVMTLAISYLVGIGGAAAQTPTSTSADPSDSSAGISGKLQLDEIVVTAQRRSERLQQVPIAVTAVSASQLESSGIDSVQQLNTVVPGLNVRSSFGSLMPSIRGISTSSNVVENPVGFYVDGVYYPNQRDAMRDLLDISQVAVLKGPQGTLFGRNSTGGVIQVTTRAPSYDFHGDASAEFANYQTGKGTAYVTGGLSEHLAASLSAEYIGQGEGYGRDHTTLNDSYQLEHQWSLRSKFLYQPGSNTDLTLILDYMDRLARSASYQPYPGTVFAYPGVGPLNSKYDTYGGTDSENAFKGGGASLDFEQQLNFAKLVSITSYRQGTGITRFDDTAVAPAYFIFNSPTNPNKDYTEELQLLSPKGRFNWVAGVYYFHSSLATDPTFRNFSGFLTPLPTSAVMTTTYGTEVAESAAPFAQVDYEIIPKTKLTAGLRYTYENRDFDGSAQANLKNGVTPPPRVTESSIQIHRTTVRAVLDHQFTDSLLGYVSYNTGIKSGGFNVLNPSNPSYLPEELKAYEIGMKSEFFDKRARVNFSAFDYNYTNIQVIEFTNGIQTIVNGAGAKLYGLDVDSEFEIVEGLHVTASLEIEHSYFTSFPGAVFSTPKPTGGATLFAADARGKRLPLAQDVAGTVGIDYARSTSKGNFHFNVTANYNGDYFFEPDNFLKQGAFVLLNTSLKWTLPNSRYSTTVWAKNLSNEIVGSQFITQAFAYSAAYANPPRTFGVTGKLQF